MIAMLGCLELDTEVSDAGIETAESNDCRGVSKKDGDANGMLATMQEGARFSCKDGQKFIDLFTQSISRLLASLEERSTRRVLGCFMGVEDRDGLKKEFLVDKATGDRFALF